MKILLVDDMESMRKVTCHLLKSLGYTDIFQASDGKGAIILLNRTRFDFVITDWNMPGLSGLDLLKYIRAQDSMATIPVLMITTEGSRKQVIEAAQAGVNSYITKPFSAATLQEKIKKVLNPFD